MLALQQKPIPSLVKDFCEQVYFQRSKRSGVSKSEHLLFYFLKYPSVVNFKNALIAANYHDSDSSTKKVLIDLLALVEAHCLKDERADFNMYKEVAQTYRKVKDGSVIFYNLENYVVNDASDHCCEISKVSAENHPQDYQFNQTEDPFYLLGSLDAPADSNALFTGDAEDLDSKSLMDIYEHAYEMNPGHRKH
ncbi:MAG: hypothetical protein OFPI_43290 [Osedax symbiont Rs2]|nr:MAG: hypothetical protein OFPI_43290 [Osedax symbiont Rs2]